MHARQGSLAHHIHLFYTCAFPFAVRLTGTAVSIKEILPVRQRPVSTPFIICRLYSIHDKERKTKKIKINIYEKNIFYENFIYF